MEEKLIKDYSCPGRKGYSLPPLEVTKIDLKQELGAYYRSELNLPEVSEVDVIRHYTALSGMNYGVDSGIYPLGSCTMKYNPKRNETVASLPGLSEIHPYQSETDLQGSLALLYNLKEDLIEISGMDEITLQPASGAHGEFTSLMIIKDYFADQNDKKRKKVLVPDSAHGTNPASAAMAGFEVVEIPSNENGMVDLAALKAVLDEETAALMLTNPNTLGIFEAEILTITKLVHQVGGLVYYDGANMNAIMGYAKPGLMNFDLMHFNLHKTFSTPHGGGGPGSGPVGVKAFLAPYLPKPVLKKADIYYWDYKSEKSIGKVHSFYGNYGIMLRARAYIKTVGGPGLKKTTENAVLNANYLKSSLKEEFELPYAAASLHEFVLSGSRQKAAGVSTLNIAKRLLDYKQYAPTIYFPLVVKEAMMIEPTETESKATLDHFVATLLTIAREIEEDPELVRQAPQTTVVSKLDETKAARQPDLHW